MIDPAILEAHARDLAEQSGCPTVEVGVYVHADNPEPWYRVRIGDYTTPVQTVLRCDRKLPVAAYEALDGYRHANATEIERLRERLRVLESQGKAA